MLWGRTSSRMPIKEILAFKMAVGRMLGTHIESFRCQESSRATEQEPIQINILRTREMAY